MLCLWPLCFLPASEDTYHQFAVIVCAAILSSVTQLNTVIGLFQSLEASQRVKECYYYQARLYHQVGYTAERNKCAHKFKQLEQQSPTLSKCTLHSI